MNIVELRLKTHCLAELFAFYGETLSWPIEEAAEGHLVLNAGNTRLVFEAGDEGPYVYHIAFNIPQNQFTEAKAWLKARVPLLMCGENEDIHWTAWNAHAAYFIDPAGNVCEFIARHNLANDSDQPFSPSSILRVSEIGLATDDVAATCDHLAAELGIDIWDAGDGEIFRAMGDEHGILIVVKSGRAWFPTDDKIAVPQPVTMTVQSQRAGEYHLPQLPYHFKMVSATAGE
ncbi:MAG: glyoxalase/bleomycin resistance/dioxygenase family protein [Chloroflexi bacterium]|nr:MAG: glyoxalase/bleomycin resistance/dioxygenase family protein [Chloroflexota bacterium]